MPRAVITKSDRQKNRTAIESNAGVVKIGRWRYVVLISCFIIMVLINILTNCFGIALSGILMTKATSSTNVAWIFNTTYFVWFLSGLFAGPLCEAFGYRRVGLISGFLLSIALSVCSFLSEAHANFLYLLYSLISGLSCGILMAICNFIVPLYFIEKRSTAISFMYIAFSTSQFVGPPLVYQLQQLYGKAASIYVLAAIIFNVCACVMTFHPIEWHRSPQACPESLELSLQEEKEQVSQPNLAKQASILDILRQMCTNATMIRSLRVSIISFSTALAIAAQLNLFFVFPFAFSANGFSMEWISSCMAISGASNIIFRVILFLVIDCIPISSKWYCISGMISLSLASLILSLSQEVYLVYLSMVFWGMSSGVVTVLPLVILEFLGQEYYSGTYGVWGLVNAFMSLIIGPLVGVIRDKTDNYNVPLYFLSIVPTSGALLWLLMSSAVAYDAKRGILQKTNVSY